MTQQISTNSDRAAASVSKPGSPARKTRALTTAVYTMGVGLERGLFQHTIHKYRLVLMYR